MDVALLLACLLLASVFVVAGAAKLADREGSRRALADFGVPTTLATPLGVLLPLAELAVAAALIPAATAWWGAAGALVQPDLAGSYERWAESRDKFNRDLKVPDSEAVKAGWQKDYVRGMTLGGVRAQEHQTKLKLRDFHRS
jgi:Methylamine utilisation protein MauE/Family of unknown function (DUF6065)